MAERIRELVAEHGDEPMPDIAELLLVFASRALHVNNVIRPALTAGTWVICDRFTDSSRAYQGGGRGLPPENIDRLAEWVHGDLVPDLTILLDAPVETGMERAGRRSDPDRFESEQKRVFSTGSGDLFENCGGTSGAICRRRCGPQSRRRAEQDRGHSGSIARQTT